MIYIQRHRATQFASVGLAQACPNYSVDLHGGRLLPSGDGGTGGWDPAASTSSLISSLVMASCEGVTGVNGWGGLSAAKVRGHLSITCSLGETGYLQCHTHSNSCSLPHSHTHPPANAPKHHPPPRPLPPHALTCVCVSLAISSGCRMRNS